MEASMIYEFVKQGLGIGIDVDIHSMESIGKDVKLIPIEDSINWNVYVAYPASNESKTLRQFLETLMN
jgi:DNA-binding transcriptional LysR family regulator